MLLYCKRGHSLAHVSYTLVGLHVSYSGVCHIADNLEASTAIGPGFEPFLRGFFFSEHDARIS